MVNLAFANASYQGGISGQVFREWLPHFVCQLACARQGHDFSHPKPIANWDEFLFSGNHFPIVAFNSSQWNEHLGEFFHSNDIPLGVFTGNFERPADVVASYWSPLCKFNLNPEKAKKITKLVNSNEMVDQDAQIAHPEKTYLFIESRFYEEKNDYSFQN